MTHMKQLLCQTFSKLTCLPFLLAGLLLAAGCSDPAELESAEEYVAYMHDPANGLVQTKEEDGLKITVRYLPPEYLAYVELHKEGGTYEQLDSLAGFYRNSATFQLYVEAADPSMNLPERLFRSVSHLAELSQYQDLLTYGMEQYIRLNSRGEGVAPVLSTLESTLEAKQKLSWVLVFNGNDIAPASPDEGGEVHFSLNRNFFLSSPADFVFEADQLQHTPKLHIKP